MLAKVFLTLTQSSMRCVTLDMTGGFRRMCGGTQIRFERLDCLKATLDAFQGGIKCVNPSHNPTNDGGYRRTDIGLTNGRRTTIDEHN